MAVASDLFADRPLFTRWDVCLPPASLKKKPRGVKPLSGFDLPAEAGSRRRVSPLTFEQMRHLEHLGCFHDFRLKVTDAQALVIWKAWPAGVPRLYSARSVMAARLAAWFLRDGFQPRWIAELLRGRPLTLLLDKFDDVLVDYRGIGWLTNRGGEHERTLMKLYEPSGMGRETWRRYPLDYLGWEGDILPRLQKKLKNPPVVWAWGKQLPVDEVLRAIAARETEKGTR